MTELIIKVEITYFGAKARSLIPGLTGQQDVVSTLRADLTAMRTPHPKTDTIELSSIGRIVCSWRTQDYKVCVLTIPTRVLFNLFDKPIVKKLRKMSEEEDAELFETIKYQQSM